MSGSMSSVRCSYSSESGDTTSSRVPRAIFVGGVGEEEAFRRLSSAVLLDINRYGRACLSVGASESELAFGEVKLQNARPHHGVRQRPVERQVLLAQCCETAAVLHPLRKPQA